jgi:arsenate reductase
MTMMKMENGMEKLRVLFVCVHNSARSQMAQTFLSRLGGDAFEAESAGLEPGKINPHVVKVMKEKGVDLSEKKTYSVFDFFKEGRKYDYVITVCDEASGEKCPIFPGKSVRFHWSFQDPSTFRGSDDEITSKVREVRDQIKKRIQRFIKEVGR